MFRYCKTIIGIYNSINLLSNLKTPFIYLKILYINGNSFNKTTKSQSTRKYIIKYKYPFFFLSAEINLKPRGA